jgi:hypothetical protein
MHAVRIARDTSADAEALRLAGYRRIGGTGRAQTMPRLSALARLLYGDELVR